MESLRQFVRPLSHLERYYLQSPPSLPDLQLPPIQPQPQTQWPDESPPESLPNTPPDTPPRTSQPQTPENVTGIQVCDGGLKGTSWEVNRFSDPRVKDGQLFITAHWEPTAVCIQDLTRGYTSCKEMVVRELGEEVWRSQKPYLQFEDAPKESSLCHKREKRPRQGRRARRRPRR